MKPDNLPNFATSPIPKTLQLEFARQLKQLSVSARQRIEFILKTANRINDDVIAEIQKVLEQELGPEQARKFIERYTPIFWERGAMFAERMLKKYGIEVRIPGQMFQILDKEVLDQLEKLQLDLVKSLTEDQKRKLALRIREGLLIGKTTDEIVKSALEVVDDTKWKLERIVRTETTRVFNLAALNRYEKAGIRKWRWFAALDERTCPICSSKHGKVFSDPSQLPPHSSHPNCRCTIVPHIEKEVEEPAAAVGEITGDRELDEKITKAINEFEKALKEEENFSRALNRFVHGRVISPEEAEKLGKMYIKNYFGGGGGEAVQSYIRHVLPYRINPKVLEKAGKVNGIRLKPSKSWNGKYDPIEKSIDISKFTDNPARTFMHELGHHLEWNACLEDSRKFFLARIRKHGYKLELLRKHEKYAHLGYSVFHFDGFDHVDPYAGRIYLGKYEKEHIRRLAQVVKDPKLIENPEFRDNLTTEMVSVGMGYFAREESMKELWEKDRELFGFILTVLRG